MTNPELLAHRVLSSYRGRPLPERAWPVGYAALIDRYRLQVVVPQRLTAVSLRYRKSQTPEWLLLSNKAAPEDSLGGHLTAALKWEGVNLGVLASLFAVVEPDALTDFITAKPKGAYHRRVWFLYEWITGKTLPIADLGKARSVDVLDGSVQYALTGGDHSSRHRVRNNLPGNAIFCPLVSRTEELGAYNPSDLETKISAVLQRTHPDVIRRAAAFLELRDSKDSFKIEGEAPSDSRLRRWAQVIGQAGKSELSVEEFLRLQRVLISDTRFVTLGLRDEGGFIGEYDQYTRAPIPEHVDARPEDLPDLVKGVIDYIDRALKGGIDPVVVAAVAAFGLVYIHPFADGNGRLHRWLIHHVLAYGGVTPQKIVFPISSVILRRLDEYRDVLESYSRPFLELIEWEETETHNVRVINETSTFYQYFDATRHAEFLYSCVQTTVDEDLPSEIDFLRKRREFGKSVQELIDFPSRTEHQLFTFLHQNDGRLSKKRREGEFEKLHDSEVEEIEELYSEIFTSLTDVREVPR
jgi:Fic/DOC family protein